MANDNQDALTTGALFLGSGAAGYAIGRWIVARWLDHQGAQTMTASAPTPVTTPPLALPPATHSSTNTPAVPPKVSPKPPTNHGRDPSVPVTSPSQVAQGPVTSPSQVTPQGPVTSPSQVTQGPVTSPSQVTQGPVTSPSQVAQGPVTSPLQGNGPSAAVTAPRGLSRRFDPVFERYRGSIPIEYLRALVERESATNPNARTGQTRGLMQIVPVVLDDYNKRHGTTYQPEHLFDPPINVAIGCELLRLIVDSYQRNHPHVPNLQADWANLRFVELLTFGWNAGFSESGGVGRVAGYLERRGITDVTIDLVHRTAGVAGASSHLSNAAKVRWCKSVAALYQRELDQRELTNPPLTTS
jgi:hypothetical protein